MDARRIAAVYRRFALREAAGRSPIYAELALRISGDHDTIAFLAGLPPEKRQPNLLFGAVQYLQGPLTGWAAFRGTLSERAGEVAAVMLARSTQTNLPARCATLLPALAALPQPLALLEVGASAGLCLYPDRYAYEYGDHRVPPAEGPASLVLRCTACPNTPLPREPLAVRWRAGLDLRPVDVSDPTELAWLDALIWPGEEHLREQLHAAAQIVRDDPPLLVAGDLRADLPSVIADAPTDATLVVFHTAVLAYVSAAADRQHFADAVRASGATWLANEAPSVIPGVVERAQGGRRDDAFLLCLDRRPLAWTDPHGAA